MPIYFMWEVMEEVGKEDPVREIGEAGRGVGH